MAVKSVFLWSIFLFVGLLVLRTQCTNSSSGDFEPEFGKSPE